MKNVVMIVTGLVAFAAAAGGSWYVKNKVLAPPPENAEADTATTDAVAVQGEEGVELAPDAAKSELMPVAVREDSMSVEELLRFSMNLKQRAKRLQDEENEFQTRKSRQQLLLADIQAEQQGIEGLRSQLEEQLSVAKDMIDQLNRIRDEILAEREKTKQEFSEIESKQIEIKDQHMVNDKKLSEWLMGMSPEKAAGVLREMANNGQMEVAVHLLANFEAREAAKILDAIEDPKLVNEFVTEFRNLKKQKKTETARK